MQLVRKVWLTLAAEAVAFGLLLFGAAGTTRWPAAWVYLVELFLLSGLLTRSVARHDPALLAERMKPLVQKGQPTWDRVLLCVLVVVYLGWMVLMGLDAVRFRWSFVPAWLQALGAVGVAVSMGISARVFRENTFLAPVVRIQKERGHKVISTGPYAVVRHPLYSAALIFLPSTALLLGSWWGLAGAALLAAILVIRTVKEDRELQRGLEGYEEYTHRVCFRLLPHVW